MFLNKLRTWMGGFLKKASSFKGKFLLYFLIIVVPFMVYPFEILGIKEGGVTIHQRKIREICFYSFGLILGSYLQKSRWLRYFIIWCLINWWSNFFIPRESFVILTNIFSALVIYIGTKQLLRIGFLKADIILRIICLSILFQCIWLIMQMFNLDPLFYPITYSGAKAAIKMPLIGWSGNPALLGAFFASTSFLFFEYFKIKKIPVFFFIVLGLSLVLKNALTVISFTVSGLFYLLNRYSLKRKYIVLGLFILCSLIAFLIFVKQPNFDRLYIWKKLVFQGIRVRPLVGSGLGIFAHLMIIDKTGTPWYEAHNDYLQMILEIGIVGFILFSGFIISRFMVFFKSKRNNKQICLMSCLVAFLISALSLFPMHITQLSFYAIILLVILEDTYETQILPS